MPRPPASEPRKKLTIGEVVKKLSQCIGLSSVILAMNYGDLLGGGADVRMHVPFKLTGVVAAQAMDIVLLGVVIFVILLPLSRTKFYPWVKLVIAVVIPPYLMWRMQSLFPDVMSDGLIPIFFAVWAAMVLLLLFRYPRWYKGLTIFGDFVGMFFAFFAMFSLISLGWVMRWTPGPNVITPVWAESPQLPRQHPLVVWVVFDELGYEQVYGNRAHDLALPNFDALRQMSTVFSNVQPVGYKTVKIIPSLLTGHAIDDYRFKFNNSFVVHYEGTHGWQPLNGSNTVFGDAKSAGWRTAAVGWYNPYCTIYGDAIDDCYFMNLDRIDGLMSQRDTFVKNTWSPLEQMVREIRAPAKADRRGCNYDVKQRLATDQDLEAYWTKLLKSDQADFVFLHLSVPHSPNVWSRMKDDYTHICNSSYLDNLALADRKLGQMLAMLESSPRWKDTTVIVGGDHGWRVDLRDWMPSWTQEDDAASGDEFDPRPALVIHRAGRDGGA